MYFHMYFTIHIPHTSTPTLAAAPSCTNTCALRTSAPSGNLYCNTATNSTLHTYAYLIRIRTNCTYLHRIKATCDSLFYAATLTHGSPAHNPILKPALHSHLETTTTTTTQYPCAHVLSLHGTLSTLHYFLLTIIRLKAH